MRLFIKNRIEVPGIQLLATREQLVEVLEFMGQVVDLTHPVAMDKFDDYVLLVKEAGGLSVKTIEGSVFAQLGDYILRGVEGENWPVAEQIFLKTYSEVL